MFRYTEKKLAKDVGKIAKTIDPSLEYTYLPDSREVTLKSRQNDAGDPHTIFLGNLFQNLSTLPRRERKPVIETFLREALTPKELSPDELMASLAMRVRTKFEIGFRNRHWQLKGHDIPPSIVFFRGEIGVEIVVDGEQSVSSARTDDLAAIGVNEEDAIRIAGAKLRRATDSNQWEKLDDHIWVSTYQDDFDFARLIAAEETRKFPFNDAPVIFAPSHSICLISDSSDPEIISKMTDLGNEHSASHRPLSQLLWTTKNDVEWQVWQPEAGTELAKISQLQSLRETIGEYEDTKGYLQKSIQEDVFIATFQAVQNDNGLINYCIYTLDVDSCLPATDTVFIVDLDLPEDQSMLGQIDWNVFEECLGSDTVSLVENINPAWYWVKGPLNTQQKDALRRMIRPVE